MNDTIGQARTALEAADDELARLHAEGAPADAVERAEEQQSDAEDAYMSAVDQWGR